MRVESGDTIHAEHVVNAGGLWAREVGRMVGLELPVLAMEHMYLLTQDMPEVAAQVAKTGHEMPMALDFAGEIYIRQEGGAMLLGTYEQACVPWSPRETPWDFGSQLLKPDLDRITPELSVAFKHYPAMGTTGIRKVVNGPFTFSPDGNPLVGPIRGLRGYWVACGVMAGLSQGGGVGLALATWMTAGDHGDSGMDIWAMDVARYGDYATLAYTNAKVQENYRRRFRITFPNEELPDARPLLTTPIRDRLTDANAVWGATFGLEHALWFQREGLEPKEDVTFRRSNAWECVAEEVAAVRERVGMTEISNYAKYRVTGPGAEAWLSSLLTARMPAPGRITLTAMLNDAGRIVGEFTVARATEADEFFLFGSLPAEVHHSRWFRHHLPADGSVRFEVLGLGLTGLSVAGPRSRDVLAAVAPDLDLSTEAFPFMTFRQVDLGMIPVHLARINYAGDLGYELWVAPEYQRALFDRIMEAGEPHGLRLFGMRALMSLRLEKSYGTWFREYRPIYTPAEGGITRYLKLDHDFIGRAAHEAELAAGGPKRRLVAFVVEPDPDDPADVIGDEPVWHDGKVVGWITSGGYGHHVQAVDRAGLRADGARDAGRPGRRRFRDRDHRQPPAGAVAAGAAVRSRRAPGCASDRSTGGTRPPSMAGGSSSTGGRSRSSPATPSRSRCSARGCRPGEAGRSAWRATAATASPRSMGSPTCGRARRRPGPACRSWRIRPGLPPLPVVRGHGRDVDAARPARSRSRGARWTSRSSAAARPGARRPQTAERAGKTVLVLDAGAGTRSWRSTPGRCSSCGPEPGCSTSTPTRSWSRPGRPRSIRSAGERAARPAHGARGGAAARRPACRSGRRWRSGRRPTGWPRRRSRGGWCGSKARSGRVRAVVTVDEATGDETTTPADTVILGLGLAPRDVLARMAGEVPLTVVGAAAEDAPLPPPPTEGVVCPCMGTTVADLEAAWDKGFTELELLKRSSQACLGTCQGGACLPHVRSWIAARTGEVPAAVHRPPGLAPDHARARRPRTPTSMPSGGRRSTTSTSRSGRGWTGSGTGGGRGTTATRSPSTGPSAKACRWVTSARSASSSCPGRTSSRPWSGCTRATSRTSSRVARATRCCSTSAATSWTTA